MVRDRAGRRRARAPLAAPGVALVRSGVVSTAAAAVVALMGTGDVAPALVADAAKILIGTVLLAVVSVLLTSGRSPGSAADATAAESL